MWYPGHCDLKWISTRPLQSGQNSNPKYQEATRMSQDLDYMSKANILRVELTAHVLQHAVTLIDFAAGGFQCWVGRLFQCEEKHICHQRQHIPQTRSSCCILQGPPRVLQVCPCLNLRFGESLHLPHHIHMCNTPSLCLIASQCHTKHNNITKKALALLREDRKPSDPLLCEIVGRP